MSSVNWSSQLGPFLVNREAFGVTANHPTRTSLAQAKAIFFNLEPRGEVYRGTISFWDQAPKQGEPAGQLIWQVTTETTTSETIVGTKVNFFKATGELLIAEGTPLYRSGQENPTTSYVFVLSKTCKNNAYLYVGVNHPDPQQTGVIGAEEEPGDGDD